MPNKAYWDIVKSIKSHPENWELSYYWATNKNTRIWIANGWPFLKAETYGTKSWAGGPLSFLNPYNWYLAYLVGGIYRPVDLND